MGPTFSVAISTAPEYEAFRPSSIPFTMATLPGRDASKGSRSRTRLGGVGTSAAPRGASGPTAASSTRIDNALYTWRIPLDVCRVWDYRELCESRHRL